MRAISEARVPSRCRSGPSVPGDDGRCIGRTRRPRAFRMTTGYRERRSRSVPPACPRPVIDDLVGIIHLPRRPARTPRLTAGRATGPVCAVSSCVFSAPTSSGRRSREVFRCRRRSSSATRRASPTIGPTGSGFNLSAGILRLGSGRRFAFDMARVDTGKRTGKPDRGPQSQLVAPVIAKEVPGKSPRMKLPEHAAPRTQMPRSCGW